MHTVNTMRTVKTVLAWALAVVLVGAAWAVTLIAPSDDAGRDTFVTTMTDGERGAGRNIAATVTQVRTTDAVASEDDWSAEGNWLVVDLAAEAVVDQPSGYLRGAILIIGDRTFSASTRGPDAMTLLDAQLVPGVPTSGSLMFELPDDAFESAGVLRLSTSTTAWGDSILELPIDLAAAPHVDEIVVTDREWTNP